LLYHFNFTTNTNPPQLHNNIDALKSYDSLSVQNVGFGSNMLKEYKQYEVVEW